MLLRMIAAATIAADVLGGTTVTQLRIVGVDGTAYAWRTLGTVLYSDSSCSVETGDVATEYYAAKLDSGGNEEYTCPCGTCTAAEGCRLLGDCNYWAQSSCTDGGTCPAGQCVVVVGLPSAASVRCLHFYENHLGTYNRHMDTVRIEYRMYCEEQWSSWEALVTTSLSFLSWYDPHTIDLGQTVPTECPDTSTVTISATGTTSTHITSSSTMSGTTTTFSSLTVTGTMTTSTSVSTTLTSSVSSITTSRTTISSTKSSISSSRTFTTTSKSISITTSSMSFSTTPTSNTATTSATTSSVTTGTETTSTGTSSATTKSATSSTATTSATASSATTSSLTPSETTNSATTSVSTSHTSTTVGSGTNASTSLFITTQFSTSTTSRNNIISASSTATGAVLLPGLVSNLEEGVLTAEKAEATAVLQALGGTQSGSTSTPGIRWQVQVEAEVGPMTIAALSGEALSEFPHGVGRIAVFGGAFVEFHRDLLQEVLLAHGGDTDSVLLSLLRMTSGSSSDLGGRRLASWISVDLGQAFSVNFWTSHGTRLNVKSLAEPMTLAIPMEEPNATCAFWDKDIAQWSTEGVETLPRVPSSDMMLCKTSHLSIFGGIIRVPELTSVVPECKTFVGLFLPAAFQRLTKPEWVGQPAAVMSVLLLLAALLAIFCAVCADWKYEKLLPWKATETMLFSVKEKSEDQEDPAACKCGRDGIQRICDADTGALNHSIGLIQSHRSRACQATIHVLQNGGLEEVGNGNDPTLVARSYTISGRISALRHVAETAQEVRESADEKFQRSRWLGRIILLFPAVHHWLNVRQTSVLTQKSVRVALIGIKVMTAAALSAAFLSNQRCFPPPPESFARFTRVAGVGIVAACVGDGVAFLLFLMQRKRILERTEWSQVQKSRQQQRWQLRIRCFWITLIFLAGLCQLALRLFLANAHQVDAAEWVESVLCILFQDLVLEPLAVAAILATVSMSTGRRRESEDKEPSNQATVMLRLPEVSNEKEEFYDEVEDFPLPGLVNEELQVLASKRGCGVHSSTGSPSTSVCLSRRTSVPSSTGSRRPSVTDEEESRQRHHLMLSGRFSTPEMVSYIRSVRDALEDRGVPTFMVDVSVGQGFHAPTMEGLYGMKAMVAFCSEDYGAQTGAGYETYRELLYAHQKKIPIIPVQLADAFPPKPPDIAGRAQNDFVLLSSTIRIDGREKAPHDVAKEIADAWHSLSLADI